MSRIKKALKEIFKWMAAGVLAVIIVNTLMFAYHHYPAVIKRNNSSTAEVLQPGSFIVNAKEGFGIYKADKYGFLNEDLPLQKDYTLVVGSSHTLGKEVTNGNRYTDILNKYLGGNDKSLAVYNCSKDNQQFYFIVNDFKAIAAEYKDAKRIIIQTDTLDVNTIQLIIMGHQHGYDPLQKGDLLYAQAGFKKRSLMLIKNLSPILTEFKEQYTMMRGGNGIVPQSLETEKDKKDAYDRALSLIRSQWDKELIIVYHPPMTKDSGDFEVKTTPSDDLFREACRKNNIKLIDLSEAAKKAYEEDGTLMYGFSNTEPGVGHLNKKGHKMIADALYEEIQKEGGDN